MNRFSARKHINTWLFTFYTTVCKYLKWCSVCWIYTFLTYVKNLENRILDRPPQSNSLFAQYALNLLPRPTTLGIFQIIGKYSTCMPGVETYPYTFRYCMFCSKHSDTSTYHMTKNIVSECPYYELLLDKYYPRNLKK